MKITKIVTNGVTLASAAVLLSGCVIDEVSDEYSQFSGKNGQWWSIHDGKGTIGNYYGRPGQPFHHYGKDYGSVQAHERMDRDSVQFHRPNAHTDDLDQPGFHNHGDKPDAFHFKDSGVDHSKVYEKGWFGKHAKMHRPGFVHGK